MRESVTLFITTRQERLIDALHDAHERAALEMQLPAYLQAQRWFGGASRQLQSVQLERWVQFEALNGAACLCVVFVTDTAGHETEHALLLYADNTEREEHKDQRPVLDALGLPEVRAELIQLAMEGGSRTGHRAELVFEPTNGTKSGCEGPGELMGVEQSNTSVRYDESCILKVYRRLERGGNPEVELSHFLTTGTDFTATPQVLSVGRVASADGYSADIFAVQEWTPSQGDGWTWSVEAARAAMDSAPDPEGVRAWLQNDGAVLAAAADLGRITAHVHAALASAVDDGLRPEPVAPADLDEWSQQVHQEAHDAADVIRAAHIQDSNLIAATERAGSYAGRGLRVGAHGLGLKTRVHGDYHLGQVLKTDDGFAVLDFEGEPAKPLAERKRLQHPLVDVAGMVRSWSYAAYTAARESDAQAVLNNVEGFAQAWESEMRRSFLDAYWAAADEAAYLPRDEATRSALLILFELRKALYEVQYELNNRPDWVEIPAGAVLRLTNNLPE